VAAAIGGHHVRVHGHTLAGMQQIMTVAGMGAVAAGAGTVLLRRRLKRA
jgi:hypothetical protein